jgi:large subunit ribosomal protein L5
MSTTQIQGKNQPRLKELYTTKISPSLQKSLGLKNVMETPKVAKVVLNVGVKEAVSDSKVLQSIMKVIEAISGQMPVKTIAKKSIAGFKIREGMHIGTRVTLRGEHMYVFLDKLINLALPKVRDFQGVPVKLDGRGNYNLGIKEWNIFPEAEQAGAGDRSYGLNITIHTTAKNDEHGFALLQELGMPFRKPNQVR